ncbi:MAG: ABC transporter ATP-binding protein, partial [Pedosphaera sp.]|nr:ABC transporter ATP-binding protein [Pedosphaera sp.]
MAESEPEVLLQVRDLVAAFDTDDGQVTAVDGVSFTVQKGRTLGIVGESGCAKSVTALSIMRLLPQPMGKILGGEVIFDGNNLATLPAGDMRSIRGNRISMIFQEPMTALNPVHRIGKQICEVLTEHNDLEPDDAWQKAIEMLDKVGIPSPEIRVTEYPHQLSGGMRQRVVIAIALACGPELVIADEPTTALDVTIQGQILYETQKLCRETGTALIWITHDLAVVAGLADKISVMYAGRVGEQGGIDDVLDHPVHPYTIGLLGSVPGHNTRGQKLHQIQGMAPSLYSLPRGCAFKARCRFADVFCDQPQEI